MNKLLTRFGIQFTNVYTDAKKLVLPQEAPIIGGLRWPITPGIFCCLIRKIRRIRARWRPTI
jgi:hypothetical protein